MSFFGVKPDFGENITPWPGEISSDPETTADRWENGNIAQQTIYGTLNSLSVVGQSLNPFDDEVTTLSGEGLNGTDRSEYGAMAAATLMPIQGGYVAAGPVKQ